MLRVIASETNELRDIWSRLSSNNSATPNKKYTHPIDNAEQNNNPICGNTNTTDRYAVENTSEQSIKPYPKRNSRVEDALANSLAPSIRKVDNPNNGDIVGA